MTNFWNKLPKPFTVLAPMENVTDMAFREMVSNNLIKPDVMFTEFINVNAIVHGALDKLKYSEKQRPIVAQIWGTNLINFEKAAKIVEDLGFDGVDINMGCPAKDVIKTGGGAGLIINPDLAIKVIQAVKNGVKNIPVSVKTRIGFDKIITNDWIPILLSQNLAALSVHVRTTKKESKGPAFWDEFIKIVDYRDKISPDTFIIGNGSVLSCNEVLEKHKTYDIDGVMIGRGVFKDPLIFDKNLHSLTKDQRVRLLEKHIELIKIHGGTINNFLKMYLRGFSGAKDLRVKYLNDI